MFVKSDNSQLKQAPQTPCLPFSSQPFSSQLSSTFYNDHTSLRQIFSDYVPPWKNLIGFTSTLAFEK